MKTNTLKVILSAIVISGISLVVMGKASAGNLLPTIAVTISYVAAVVILAVAALDRRTGPKDYATR